MSDATELEEPKPIKDANDVLQRWAAEGVEPEIQQRRVRELLNGSRTMAEAAAEWAGRQEGADRDRALKVAVRIIAEMQPVTLADYRERLADALRMGVRNFDGVVKAARKGTDEKGERQDIVETLGGVIGGWLVQYLYDPETGKAALAYRDPDRKIGQAEFLVIDDKRYVPKMPGSFIRDGAVLFPSELGQLKPTRELVAIVDAFISEHYLLEFRYYSKIMSYYVLLTWLYDCFNALPYLRAMGDAGAGKSELMRRVGHLCYRLLTSSGASSEASFFRATEMYRGTVFIDEADLADGGDMSNALVKFLNQGAMKGTPIMRLEEVTTIDGGRAFEPAVFQAFGPKLIAMRKDFRDAAVGSRCITIPLQPREPIELRSAGVRLHIDEEFRRRARAIRNLLLRWRLERWEPEIAVSDDLMDLEVSSRLNQVTMPLKALAQDDQELMTEIERFLRFYNQEMIQSKAMTVAARVVEALWKIYNYEDLHREMVKKILVSEEAGEDEYMMINDVRRIANEIMDEMNAGDDDEDEDKKKKRKRDELSAKGVGNIIRNELQLRVGRRRGNGFPVMWDEMKMTGLAKRYGINPDDFKKKPGTNGSHPPEQTEMFDLNRGMNV